MSEDKIQRLEMTVNEHTSDIRGINVALSEITQTLRAFASGLVELRTNQQVGFNELRASQQAVIETQQESFAELRASQQAVIETQRTTLEAVDRLANTVEDYALRSSQEIASLAAAVERLDRIVDYLMRCDSDKDGN